MLFWNTPTRAIMPMTIPRNSPVDWRVDVLWRWQAKMIAMITRQNRSLIISLKAYILLTVPLCADFPFTIPHCLPKNILFCKKHCLSSASDNGSHEGDVVSEGKSVCFFRVALRKQYRLLTFSGICEKIAALNLETREAFL